MDPKVALHVNEYRRRLLAPDFDGFEAYFGCAVPPELRQFYELGERLLGGVLYATVRNAEGSVLVDLIQYAAPLNSDNWTRRYGREYFQFATNTDGYPLLIKPSSISSPVFADWGDRQPSPDIE